MELFTGRNAAETNIGAEDISSPSRLAIARLRQNKLAMTGLYVLLFIILLSIVGPIISPYKMDDVRLVDSDLTPSLQHPLGTDNVGRDVLTRLMYAGRISMTVGISAVFLQILIGSLLGIIAGYYGGFIDSFIMRCVDVLMCFPDLIILIVFSALMSDLRVPPEYRIFIVMFIIGILGWTGLCRIVRGQVLSLKEQEFMLATEALGIKDWKKMMRHLLPNTYASIIVTATLGIGGAILAESALSFLGLGVTPPIPSWGQMVQVVNELYTLQYEPWKWVPPGLLILLVVMSVNLLGDGLRDALDPKLKK